MNFKLHRRQFLIGSSAFALGAAHVVKGGFPPALGETTSGQIGTRIIDANETLAEVPSLAFGVNLLATRDNIYGTYGDRIEQIRPTLLRWPGGAISTGLFRANGRMNTNYVTQLRGFLRYCERHDITPAIVIPADSPIESYPVFRRACRRLVHNVTRTLANRRRQIIWEFGNECYCKDLGPEGTVHYARQFNILRGVLNNLRPSRGGYNDLTGIIAGSPTRRIDDWAEPLSRLLDPGSYDLLTFHSYPANYFIYTLPHIDTARSYLGNKPVFMSEWNQISCWNPEFGFEGGNCDSEETFYNNAYGIRLGGAMVSHFAQMLTYNIHSAAFWAVQQNNMTSMFPNEGRNPDQAPYISGEVFKWIRATEGMRLVALSQTPSEEFPAHFAFANRNRMELFIDARNSTDDFYDVEIRNFDFSRYWGFRLSGEPNVRQMIPDVHNAEAVRFGNRIRVPLRQRTSHELIRVVLRR